jgi:hypothetical protein
LSFGSAPSSCAASCSYLELIHGIQQRKNSPEYVDDDEYLADVYAYQGKFAAAADLYVKVGKSNKVSSAFFSSSILLRL